MTPKPFCVVQVPLPAVLKVETGSSGRGVRHVSTLHEAELQVQHVKDLSSQDEAVSSELVMMKRVMGTEHSVDVVLFEGQLVAAFVTDKGPTHFPLCWQTTNVMPSLLSEGRGAWVWLGLGLWGNYES